MGREVESMMDLVINLFVVLIFFMATALIIVVSVYVYGLLKILNAVIDEFERGESCDIDKRD
jgi:hypothetical protein